MEVTNSSGYKIHINEPGALSHYLEQYDQSKIFVLVDEHTEQMCLVHILEILPESAIIIQIDAGEKHKNIDTATFIWKSLLANGADRTSLMINLGGGVVGDIGGFCASTYMRGIKFIQMPTTLLSQVDASVGGKMAVDLENIKNIVGVFSSPVAVIIDTRFLRSLSYKELLSGYAEIIKHCLICDAAMWHTITSELDILSLDMYTLVAHSVGIKNKIVASDPLEAGRRKILNFGHTIGHGIESMLIGTEKEMLHGEAVAIGMVCEAHLSFQKGNLSFDECSLIRQYLIGLYGHKYKSIPDYEHLLTAMRHDKKNVAGHFRFSLLEKIGKAIYDIEVKDDELKLP